jgi:hypothetical protein
VKASCLTDVAAQVNKITTARTAAGCVLEMALAVARNELKNGFALVRPCGRRAQADTPSYVPNESYAYHVSPKRNILGCSATPVSFPFLGIRTVYVAIVCGASDSKRKICRDVDRFSLNNIAITVAALRRAGIRHFVIIDWVRAQKSQLLVNVAAYLRFFRTFSTILCRLRIVVIANILHDARPVKCQKRHGHCWRRCPVWLSNVEV